MHGPQFTLFGLAKHRVMARCKYNFAQSPEVDNPHTLTWRPTRMIFPQTWAQVFMQPTLYSSGSNNGSSFYIIHGGPFPPRKLTLKCVGTFLVNSPFVNSQ